MENIRRDLRSMGELKTAQRILNSYNFNGIEVAEYTNSYSNLVTGTSIFIDVDAYTGGFNLQIAFSTGYLAGENV